MKDNFFLGKTTTFWWQGPPPTYTMSTMHSDAFRCCRRSTRNHTHEHEPPNTQRTANAFLGLREMLDFVDPSGVARPRSERGGDEVKPRERRREAQPGRPPEQRLVGHDDANRGAEVERHESGRLQVLEAFSPPLVFRLMW